MRRVTFIKSLNMESLPMVSDVEYHTCGSLEATPVPTNDSVEFLLTDKAIHREVVPVHRFITQDRYGRDEKYIAWSKDVQEFLGTPFDILKKQLDEQSETLAWLYAERDHIRSSGWWNRMKFLFSGKTESL